MQQRLDMLVLPASVPLHGRQGHSLLVAAELTVVRFLGA